MAPAPLPLQPHNKREKLSAFETIRSVGRGGFSSSSSYYYYYSLNYFFVLFRK